MRHDVYGLRNERCFNLRLYAQHDCRITRKEIHKLREYISTLIHNCLEFVDAYEL